jgi:hypothetical protein
VSPAPTPPNAFAYEACDIPAGMTIREYRSQQALAAHHPTLAQRARQVLGKVLRVFDPAREPH